MYASNWSTPVALAVVMTSVLFLVVFPRLASRRNEGLRNEIEKTSGPARTAAGAVERALALEVAAARGYVITGASSYRDRYRATAAAASFAVAELEALATQLGGEIPPRVAAFKEGKAQWEEPIDALLAGRMTRDAYVSDIDEQQRRFEESVERLRAVDTAIVASEASRRGAIREGAQMEGRLIVVAAIVAFLSAVAAGALTRRLRQLTRRVHRRAEEEQELRLLARALSGALSVQDVAQQVVEGSVSTTRASGAYIELFRGQEVLVAAAAGRGAPAGDTRSPYPGSLTQAMVQEREPEIVRDVSLLGESMAPLVAGDCPRCAALVVPLFSQDDVLGALVLLRGPAAPPFEEPDVTHARIVGDLASAALGRVMLLEETQRERAALKASEEQFRALAETAQVGIFVIAQDDTIVFANPPVERIFGYKLAELIGQPMVRLIPAALRHSHRAGIERYSATETRHIPWEGVELPGLAKDGREIPLEITIGEFTREGKRYFTGIARDITDRRRAEEERAALLVREREARARAEAAIRTREEVLAIVSHDLRNPLNTISMGASALSGFTGDEATRAKYIQMIQRAIQRMNRLIEDLLDVVRLEAGQRLALEPKPLELERLIAELCESFTAQAAPNQQTFTCECAPGLPPVVADRDRLGQVLANLVGNALKFTPEGGRVTLRASSADVQVLIAVEDTGPGISPEDLPRIFDPYWQAGRTARLGAGLGLTIAKGIVEAHGGSIWVESRPGAGSTFTFALPFAGPETPAENAAVEKVAGS